MDTTLEQKLNGPGRFNVNTGEALPSRPALSTQSLQGAKPFTLPNPSPTTSSAGLLASTEAYNTQATEQAKANLQGLTTDTSKKSADNSTLFNTLVQRLTNKQGSGALTDTAYSETVDPAQKELNDINAQISAKSLGYRREIEAIQKDGNFTKEQASAFVANKERQAASELADLSIIQQAKLNNYSSAKEIADRKVQAQLEKDKNELDALTFFYTENKKDLDKEDDRNFNALITERTRLLSEKTAEKKSINDYMLLALQNGAPADIAQKIGSAQTYAEALAAGSAYASDPLDKKLKQAQYDNIQSEIYHRNHPEVKSNTQIVDVNGKKFLVDTDTGQTIREIAPGEIDDTKAQQIQEALSLAQELRKDTSVGKKGAVGASLQKLVPFGKALGLQGDRTAFEAKVESLKSNLTLDNLKLLKGAMSDKDIAFLNSVGSSLDLNMSETQFNKELDRVIGKLEGANKGTTKNTVVTAPDGQQIQIID